MKLAPLALVLLASTASARKIPCRSEGPTVVEVKVVKLDAGASGHETKLFEANGWLAHDTDKDGKASNETKGCIAPSELHELQAKLAKAKWKVTTARVHCMAMATSYTEYIVKGKVVWTAKMCSGQTLDKDSAAAIAAVDDAIAKMKP